MERTSTVTDLTHERSINLETNLNLVSAKTLHTFCQISLETMGVSPEDAKVTADVLLEADLRGVDSHGVARLSFYVSNLRKGVMRPQAKSWVVHETPTTAVLDGDGGLGQPVSHRAMELAIAKAREHFLGFVAVRNSNHYGIAGYYAMMALAEDMIGFSVTNSLLMVLPTFGRNPKLGTNPIAIAVPAGKERPYVLDMATATAPRGKVEIYNRLGKPIPLSWATDEHGVATDNAPLVLRNLNERRGGGLLPLGGAVEETGGHKGYGLALAVEIFSGVLSGAAYSDLVYPSDEHGKPLPANLGHFFGAMRIDGFRSKEAFKTDMDDLIRRMKDDTKAEGHDRIYLHGEKEYEQYEVRQREGIPLNPKVAEDLCKIASELGLEKPF
jgi:L-2-hydroxycarboxylate dehydrogenase (NAD+)